MRKAEQKIINEVSMDIFEKAYNELPQIAHSYMSDKQMKKAGVKKLRSCNAWVWETENFYILQSYSTFIACIEKSTDTCYDVLRVVYGYTSTSSQHVTKFRQDYGAGMWGCEHVYTAR